MAPSVEKKIAELEMGLLHLQQNIDIPEITLSIHPTVLAQIKKCHEQGVRARVEDFGDKVSYCSAVLRATVQNAVKQCKD